MDEQRIRRDAAAFAHSIFEGMAQGHPDRITTEWLMGMHPELSKEEAEEYRQFCAQNTLVFRACYGDGSIMWPRWTAFKAEIASL